MVEPTLYLVCINRPQIRISQRYSPVTASPGLTQTTLVLYAYEIGSQFDFQMNYYMTTPFGINPAKLGTMNNETLFDPSVGQTS